MQSNFINKTKAGNLFGTIGVLGGIAYGIKNKKSNMQTAVWALVFGVTGLLIGNATTNFFE